MSRRARAALGLSLIELLVGITVGLAVAAACALLWTGQIREERSRLASARLTQDLHAALALMTRDLRRAGYWGDAGRWFAGSAGAASAANPYAAVAPASAASDVLTYRYSLDSTEDGVVGSHEQFGFRLRAGTLEAQLGSGNWQALTDPAVLTITGFQVTPTPQTIDLGAHCSRPCPAGLGDCPPRLALRSFDLALAGRLVDDAHAIRSARSRVLLRNSPVTGRCAP